MVQYLLCVCIYVYIDIETYLLTNRFDDLFVDWLSKGLKLQRMTCDTGLQKQNLATICVRLEEMLFYRLPWREGSKLFMSVALPLNKMYTLFYPLHMETICGCFPITWFLLILFSISVFLLKMFSIGHELQVCPFS